MKIKLKTKDIIFIIIVAAGLVMFVIQKLSPEPDSDKTGDFANLAIKDARVSVEIADTDESRYLGLGGRNSIGSNRGMLFVHESPGRHSYAMRGMLFDLDLVFIRENKVADIAKNVAFEYPGAIQGAADYDMVLEVNAGWVRANGVKIGDEVVIE